MPRPHTYVGSNTTQNERKWIHGYLKGKSSVLNYQRFTNLQYKYMHREFWCRGYYVDTVGKNTQKIKEYIANQLKEDKLTEQMTITEVIDPIQKLAVRFASGRQ